MLFGLIEGVDIKEGEYTYNRQIIGKNIHIYRGVFPFRLSRAYKIENNTLYKGIFSVSI